MQICKLLFFNIYDSTCFTQTLKVPVIDTTISNMINSLDKDHHDNYYYLHKCTFVYFIQD